VIEVRDIRLPESSKIRFLHTKFQTKNKIVLLTKKDMVSSSYCDGVLQKMRRGDLRCYAVKSSDPQALLKLLKSEIIPGGIAQKSLLKISRALIVGLPNVGKSSLINAIRGRNVARVANVPGVTKGRQWIKISQNCYLLDSPGVATLTHSSDRELKMKFAACRMISEKEFDFEELSLFFLGRIKNSAVALEKLADLQLGSDMELVTVLELVAKRFGCFARGGGVDLERAARRFCDLVEERILPDLDLDGFIS
jgi:ribosome biogenesis GTPase A